MISREITNKSKTAQVKINECQAALKDKFLEWEKLKHELKSDPMLATRKRLGNEIL